MTPGQIIDIEATLVGMAQRQGDDLADFITTRAIESGGFFKPAQPGNDWDNQVVEITLHGVFGQGADLAEAARNWSRAARFMIAQRAEEGA